VQYDPSSPPCSLEELETEIALVEEVFETLAFADSLAQRHHRSLLDQLQESQQTLSETGVGLKVAGYEFARLRDYQHRRGFEHVTVLSNRRRVALMNIPAKATLTAFLGTVDPEPIPPAVARVFAFADQWETMQLEAMSRVVL
jgi:hypothetical protein